MITQKISDSHKWHYRRQRIFRASSHPFLGGMIACLLAAYISGFLSLAGSLDPAGFFRISRSCIISEGVIDSVSRLMGGRLRISLRPGLPSLTDFTVSRARVDGFMEWLEK